MNASILRSNSTRSYRRLSQAVRSEARLAGAPYPIETVDGFAAPALVGDGYHWTTPGGRPVRFPSAYRAHFGRPVYHASTLRIQVGRGWLIEQGLV